MSLLDQSGVTGEGLSPCSVHALFVNFDNMWTERFGNYNCLDFIFSKLSLRQGFFVDLKGIVKKLPDSKVCVYVRKINCNLLPFVVTICVHYRLLSLEILERYSDGAKSVSQLLRACINLASIPTKFIITTYNPVLFRTTHPPKGNY